MRRGTGRVGAFVLALSCLAPLTQAADDTDPGYGMPTPADATKPAAADPTADQDEAQRLEGDAKGKPLSSDVNDANKAARDALQDALDLASPQGPVRNIDDAIKELSGIVSLSLDEAIRVGLERNLDLDVVRFDPYIAGENVGIAWGAYDPTFANEFGYKSATTPVASIFITQDTVQTNLLDGKTGMKGLVPWWGASYEVGYTGGRTYSTNSTTTLSPQLDANVYGNITMPLLKNLIWNQPWTQVKTSQVAFQGSWEDFRTQVMNIVQRIENAYWEVIATREQLRVAQKSVETARALLDQTKTQYEVGVVSKVEVTEAEAGVAQRDFNLIVASNAYRAAEDTLADLVFGESLRPASTYRLVTTDEPTTFTAFDVDPEVATKKAFGNRPELAALKLEIERQQILLKFAHNQTLPQLDAVLGYGRLGQAGEVNPSIFGPNSFLASDPTGVRQAQLRTLQSEASRSLSAANNDFFGTNTNNQFSARGLLSIPLGNEAAAHTADKTAFELRKTVSRERRLEQDIVLGVRKAIRDLRSSQEGVLAAERSVASASEQLRAERIRLDNGESTPFNVLQRESDLVTAESGKIDALRVYRNSSTNLDRAQGTILKTHRIKIDEVGALR
jgi:outer membrane protein TolC